MNTVSLKQKFLVVDDHELILDGLVSKLLHQYPAAEILTVQTVQDAREKVKIFQPDLVILDLSIPEVIGQTAQIDTGLKFIQELMSSYPSLNLAVQTSYVKTLVRIKYEIDNHTGGFTIIDKAVATKEMLTRIDGALKGWINTKELRSLQKGLEFKPEWFEVLNLAFRKGLKDCEIAQRMNVAERTVRNYWTKIYDVLDIFTELERKNGKSIRILTEIRAREKGLID